MENRVTLPLETQYHIIESFNRRADKGSIASCALVCRAWLPISRRMLYSFIIFNYRREWIAFYNAMFHSNSQSLAQCRGTVRELWVNPSDQRFFDEACTQPRIGWLKHQERPWAHLVLVQSAMQLTSLTTLLIQGVDWNHLNSVAIDCGPYHHSLTTLSLVICTFPNIIHLHQFVTAFPALRVLQLVDPKVNSARLSLQLPKTGHSLHSLHVGSNHNSMVTLWTYFSAYPRLVHNLSELDWMCQESQKGHEAWTATTETLDFIQLETLRYFLSRFWHGACTDTFSQMMDCSLI